MTSLPAHAVGAASVAIVAAAALAMAAYGPIAAPPGYHDFADQSVAWGIPHAGDVLSNAAFAVVALGAVAVLWPCRRLGQGWPVGWYSCSQRRSQSSSMPGHWCCRLC